MTRITNPEDLLSSQVEEFDKESIRLAFQEFIDRGVKLEARARRVLHAGNLALLITEWSIKGTEPDGKTINLTGRGTIVLRRQSDGTWLMVIENPWGTD